MSRKVVDLNPDSSGWWGVGEGDDDRGAARRPVQCDRACGTPHDVGRVGADDEERPRALGHVQRTIPIAQPVPAGDR